MSTVQSRVEQGRESRAAALSRREAQVPRMTLVDPIAEKWATVTETVRWIVADDELADRLLVALANLAPPSVEIA